MGSTTYTFGGTGTSFQAAGGSILFSALNGSNGAVVAMDFPGTTAPAAGTYKVVSGDSTIGANQVSFSVGVATSGTVGMTYSSTGAGTVNLTLGQTSTGKYTITMPSAPVMADSGTATTTVSFTNITQN